MGVNIHGIAPWTPPQLVHHGHDEHIKAIRMRHPLLNLNLLLFAWAYFIRPQTTVLDIKSSSRIKISLPKNSQDCE